MWIIVFQRLCIEFFLDILYFPIWWYTGGAVRAFRFCLDQLKVQNAQLAPGLWLRNVFVPMYGQYDWQGRLMSFFIRLANVFFRSIILFFWLLIFIALFALWLVCPLFISFELFQSSFGA